MSLPSKNRLPWESISSGETPSSFKTVRRSVADFDADQTIILERQQTGALAIAEAHLTPPPPPPAQDDFASTDQFDDEAAEFPAQANLPAPAAPARIRAVAQQDGGGWTISLLCMGLALIAACVLIPQTDANRRLVYERAKLDADLNQIHTQIAVNKEFLQKVQTDPQLLERLAQREMKMVRQGETVLDIKPTAVSSTRDQTAQDAQKMSPFLIVDVPPPAPLPPYKPVGGLFADLCRQPRSQLYILGAALFMVATALVLGSPNKA